MNTFTAGSLVGKFYSEQEEDVRPAMEMMEETCGVPTTNGREPVCEHLVDLYGNACEYCKSNRERLVVAQLLS